MSRLHIPHFQERNHAPQGHETAEYRFLAVMQESADVFWCLSPGGEMRGPSSSWHTFTGQQTSQCLGRGWFDALHPADQPRMEQLLQQVVTNGTTAQMECHLRRGNRTYRLIQVRAIPVRIHGGTVHEVVACGTDITKQEQAGQMSEAEVQLALKGSGVGMWDWDLVTNQVNWTDQGKALLGVAPTHPLDYDRFLATLHPEDREPVDRFLARAVAERTDYQTEYRIRWPDGSIHWLSDRGHCISDAQDHPMHMVGAIINITDLKQAKEESTAILESITDGFVHLDTAWRLIYTNQLLTTIVRRTREELVGQTLWDAFPALRGSHLENRLREAMATQQTVHFETLKKWFGRWFEVHIYPAPDGLSVYFRDITERKQAEKALRQSRDAFHLLTEAMPQLVWITGASGEWEYANQQWYTYTGGRTQETLGEAWISCYHPDDRLKVQALWQTSLLTSRPFQVEARLRQDKTGDHHWFLVRAVPITLSSGQIWKWVGTCTDIHEKKRIEEALRESEVRFRRLVDSNLIGIMIADLAGTIEEANDAFLNLVGYSREEVTRGQVQWTAMTPPEYRARDAQALEELHRTGMFQPFAKEYVGKDGRRVPVLLGGTLFRKTGAKPLALCFIVDLTAQRAAEEERQKADRRIGTILASITNVFAHLDAQWRYTYVNPPGEKYAGKSREALLGQSFWEINPEMLGTPMEHKLREAMAAQQVRHFEAWHPRWQRWLEVHAYPAEGGLSLYSQDITERKQAEEALRESDVRFRHLMQSNILGITMIDLEGPILEANDAFLSLLGYTQQDLVAGRLNWRALTPPEHQESSTQAVREVQTTGMAQLYEKEYLAKDGKRVPVLVGTVVFRREGSTQLAISFVLDLTARKEIERQKDLFLGMTGHELKTPLAALRGTLQLIQRRMKRVTATADPLPPALRAFFDGLTKSVTDSVRQIDVQTRLINDLLDVSRITANTLKLERERFNLTSIVRQTVEDLRVTAPERALLLDVPEQTEVSVLADRDRISQVITNYVTNALRYSPADQPVQIGLTIQEDVARVWVRDHGPGLSEAAQKELWQRFRQIKGVPVQSGSGKGLGLGLYICQTLIAQHQGEVGVESALGEGSTFWFTLPLIP